MIERTGLSLIPPSAAGAAEKSSGGAVQAGKQFGQFLSEALNGVRQQEQVVNDLNTQFAAGENVDVHQLLIASQKASLALELTVQFRNKAVEAYQEIMRTQV